MKASEISEWARGNGIPCHGDLIETVVDGERFRAEFYAKEVGGAPQLRLAADSFIEKEVGGEWVKVEFPDTSEGDEMFSVLLAQITPDLEDDR